MGPALGLVLREEPEMQPGFAVQVLPALVLLVQQLDWAVLPQVQLQQGRPVHAQVVLARAKPHHGRYRKCTTMLAELAQAVF